MDHGIETVTCGHCGRDGIIADREPPQLAGMVPVHYFLDHKSGFIYLVICRPF